MLTSRELLSETGLSYRKLDYWVRMGVVETASEPEPGSGQQRLFRDTEATVVHAVMALRAYGASTRVMAEVAQQLRVMDDAARIGVVYVSGAGTVTRWPGTVCWRLDLDGFTSRPRTDKVAAWQRA